MGKGGVAPGGKGVKKREASEKFSFVKTYVKGKPSQI